MLLQCYLQNTVANWEVVGKHTTASVNRRNLVPTTTMERLPTEMIIQVLSYMSQQELKVVGFISSEYRSLVLPFLFHRIRPWLWAVRQRTADLITCLRVNARLSSVVRVIDAQYINGSKQPVEEIRRIMELTTGWEELILPPDVDHLLEIFDDNTKLQLRRLSFPTGDIGPEFSHFLLDILPACTNLIELEIPQVAEDWFKTFDPAGSAAGTWINRLEKYRGPSYPLNYLHSNTPLYQLTSQAEVLSPVLQSLGRLVGQQLLALHVRVTSGNRGYRLTGTGYLTPSPIPSLFPYLRYVAWFLIMSQPESLPVNFVRFLLALTPLFTIDFQDPPQTKPFGDYVSPDVKNRTLFDAIQQLPHLRRVWFTSHHSGDTLPEPVLTFIQDVQELSLLYLQAIYLWAPSGKSWSYSFRKEELVSIHEGPYIGWACETNKPVSPVFS